jgi:hypothetical protein
LVLRRVLSAVDLAIRCHLSHHRFAIANVPFLDALGSRPHPEFSLSAAHRARCAKRARSTEAKISALGLEAYRVRRVFRYRLACRTRGAVSFLPRGARHVAGKGDPVHPIWGDIKLPGHP